MNSKPLLKVAASVVLLALVAAPLQAKLAWNKKAKKYDSSITACTACHVPEKPKKNDPLSERGQWLVDEQARRGAKEINLEWLKDYPNFGKNS
ncbi:MAG: hypothetical protein Q8M02_04245 [Candidatus Didemnitutus sp.]|nr:hypothetical protein [Candidatus Didemnitutus sp.]